MTDYKKLCAELIDAWDSLPWQYDWKGNLTGLDDYPPDDSAVERARAALAEPKPEGPTDEPVIPNHYRGDDIRVYREGFHAGYKYAFQLMEKCSDRSAQPS